MKDIMNNKKTTLTVFTPTYNRAYCLHQGYEALKRQTCKDFIWLVIDDGSTDNTRELIEKWQKEADFTIKYIYQENRGMVAAHNTAHYSMNTELCVCIDSDDHMPDDAIGKILKIWQEKGYEDCAGIVGLDAYKNGDIVGTKLPDIPECKFSELYTKYKISGDKKFVHNRKVFNKYLPYPKIDNEKFPVTSYLYLFIEQNHKLIIANEVFCIVEYLPDGLTMNLFDQYKRSPKSFAFYRIAKMRFALSYNDRFKNAIHYVSSSIMAKNKDFLKKSPYIFTTLLATPLGIVLYFYLLSTKKKGIHKS